MNYKQAQKHLLDYGKLGNITYNNVQYIGLMIVPTDEKFLGELAKNFFENEPNEKSELIIKDMENLKVVAVSSFDARANKFTYKEVTELAKEMEDNNFDWQK